MKLNVTHNKKLLPSLSSFMPGHLSKEQGFLFLPDAKYYRSVDLVEMSEGGINE